MAEQSDQDVDMEPAHPDTEVTGYLGGRPTSITNNTNQGKEPQNTHGPPQQDDQQAIKDMQQDQEQRRHVTGREVMQAARPLQMLLRKNPEQPHYGLNPATQTPAKDNEVQPGPTPQDPNSKHDNDPISPPTTAGTEQPTKTDYHHHHGATTTTSPRHQDTTTTKEHLHALYTNACDELGIPDEATNTSMQQMASEIYQDILSYADHLMAILRILTLAKNTTTKSGRQAKTPLTQLLYLVSRGWTLDQGQHNQMQEGMSRMGLAICLTQLLTHDQLKAGQSDLTSFYVDYIYRLSFLQQQYHPPLFLSQRRHCGHNLHAIQLVDPVLVNTTNNSEHQLRQGDLHILLTAAKSEYEKRHWNNQCDTCYKPGLVRREWKPITGQFAILQLRPASGDRYLPVMRSDKYQQDHNILHNLRGRKATLWGREYAVAGAVLGVASNPNELAETAFLQLPTLETPSKYHIYQGTQCSRTIEQEHIPSWWVVLAIVLHEANSTPDPQQQQPKNQGNATHQKKAAQKTTTSNKPPTNAVIAYVSNPKHRVRKTICKRRSRQKSSQHTTANQRKAALQKVLRVTSKGPPANQPKKPRTTYQQTNAKQGPQQKLLTLTPPNTGTRPPCIDIARSALPDDRPAHEPSAHLAQQPSTEQTHTAKPTHQHPNYQHYLDYPEDIQATDDQLTNNAKQQLPVPPAHDSSPQEHPSQDVDMQPVPYEDDTEPNMYSEAKEQKKPQAPQLETNIGRDSVNPDQQVQLYPPPRHTEANHQTEPRMLPPKAGMGRDPVTPNHA